MFRSTKLTFLNKLTIVFDEVLKKYNNGKRFSKCILCRSLAQRSFLLNERIARTKGAIIHTSIIPRVYNKPALLPRKSLYMAPVYPINALMSILSMMNILPRSTGLRDDKSNVIFSSG